MGKTILFCADGTWNGPRNANEEDGDAVEEGRTNVYKLFANLHVQTPADETAKEQEPDELDMRPTAEEQPEEKPEQAAPSRPEWMDYTIKSIPHRRFFGRKISELEPEDLRKIESQWMPKIEADMENANADQKLEYKYFASAIAYNKAEKPFSA